MLEKVQQENPDLIVEVRIVPADSIRKILAELRPEFDPVLWGSNTQKIKDYVLQLDHVKKKDIPLRISNDFKLIEIPVYQKTEDVLNSIRDGEYNTFKELVPKSIGSEFFNLQKELELSNS